jgi:MoxR-like ATPase
MNLSTFSRLALGFYKSHKSIYLRSAPGRGKTSTIVAAVPSMAKALDKNLGLVVINGPNLTPGDTIGFGVPKHSTGPDGRPLSEMVFTLPFFWRTSEGKLLEEYDGGVIFVDEADKMDVDIKKVMGEMALSGRCGSHTLPPGWVVWMAGNRQEDRSGSTKELDHLINRRFEINVTDDLAGWEQWALRNNVHPSIVAFAVGNPQVVFPDKLPEKQGPFCTPRSLVAAGELLVTLAGNNDELPTDTDAIEVASAGIGEAAAAQLFATLRLAAELPEMSTIINAPGQAKLPSKPDAQMLVCYKLAHLTDQTNIGPIVKYVERLPADFAATYAKAAITRQPMLAATPTILEWAKKNSTLLAIIGQLK